MLLVIEIKCNLVDVETSIFYSDEPDEKGDCYTRSSCQRMSMGLCSFIDCVYLSGKKVPFSKEEFEKSKSEAWEELMNRDDDVSDEEIDEVMRMRRSNPK